jgi:hypothetical protein
MNNKNSKKIDSIRTNIKKYDEYIIIESNEEIIKEKTKKSSNIGLDLTNNKSGYKIDLIRYGKDII